MPLSASNRNGSVRNVKKSMQTIDLNLNGTFLIERCEECYGLFFDPGQVEALLENTVTGVFEINLQHLDTINNDRFQGNKPVKYIKCPVCHVLMNRHAYGYRSGVIIDRCRNHGVWLNSGEITHLLEWRKAGGQLLHDKQSTTENRVAKSKAKPTEHYNNPFEYNRGDLGPDAIDAVLSVLSKLF